MNKLEENIKKKCWEIVSVLEDMIYICRNNSWRCIAIERNCNIRGRTNIFNWIIGTFLMIWTFLTR